MASLVTLIKTTPPPTIQVDAWSSWLFALTSRPEVGLTEESGTNRSPQPLQFSTRHSRSLPNSLIENRTDPEGTPICLNYSALLLSSLLQSLHFLLNKLSPGPNGPRKTLRKLSTTHPGRRLKRKLIPRR